MSEEVAAAVTSGAPVVALESTIISHGMPFPQNLEMARAVEDVVRSHGAVPATVAIVDGVPRVGLTDEQLAMLAEMGGRASKVSRRDVAACVARGATGATTVSATMLLAHRAGIEVFVTGGIGGVHRGGEHTMDVSGMDGRVASSTDDFARASHTDHQPPRLGRVSRSRCRSGASRRDAVVHRLSPRPPPAST